MVDKRVKQLPSGEIEFKGIKYPGFTAHKDDITFDSKKWFEHWEKLIDEIKESKFDIEQINDIFDEFKTDLMSYGLIKQMTKEHQRVNEIGAKLKIAFHKSYSNYRDSKKGFWSFVSGLFINKTLDKLNMASLLKLNK